MCVLIFYTPSETFLILNIIRRDITTNVHMPLCKVPVTLCRFTSNLNFLGRFETKIKHQTSSKSIQWEPSCPTRTDRQTDMIRNSANVPENQKHVPNEMAYGIRNNFGDGVYFPKLIYASEDKGFSSGSDGIETRLRAGWPEVRIPVGASNFPLLHNVPI